jgi:hypothetical protein
MALRLLFSLILVSALSLFPDYTRGDGGANQAAAPDTAQGTKVSNPEDGKEDPGKIKERQEKEYWCKRSAYYKKRIEKAQYEVDKEEELLSELDEASSVEAGKDKKYIDKKINKTRDKLSSAKKLLKDREGDLGRLEDEARKRHIPSEWLQCQPAL